MKKVFVFIAMFSSVFAFANSDGPVSYQCSAFDASGNPVAAKVAISLSASGTTVSSKGGTDVTTPNGVFHFNSIYDFANVQTRCAAGETLMTSIAGKLSLSLYAWNSCDPSSSIPGDWLLKGSISFLQENQSEISYLLACEASPPPLEGADASVDLKKISEEISPKTNTTKSSTNEGSCRSCRSPLAGPECCGYPGK